MSHERRTGKCCHEAKVAEFATEVFRILIVEPLKWSSVVNA
jgi:hypothetical protein